MSELMSVDELILSTGVTPVRPASDNPAEDDLPTSNCFSPVDWMMSNLERNGLDHEHAMQFAHRIAAGINTGINWLRLATGWQPTTPEEIRVVAKAVDAVNRDLTTGVI